MAPFTSGEIDLLISCSKEIAEAPAKALKLVDADWRNGAKLRAADVKGVFSMFMRKNDDFPENFSVGLSYNAQDGRPEITLLRCNGKHGQFTGLGDAAHPHWGFHIHTATEEAQNAGFAPEKYASISSDFASYEEALQYFVKRINLNPQQAAKYFPNSIQHQLFTK